MKHITQEQAEKLNLLNLVREHREKCEENCCVSLSQILSIALKAGIVFSVEEAKLFV